MMPHSLVWIDALLRRSGTSHDPLRWLSLILCQGLCGLGYGFVMGSFGEWDSNRFWYALFAGLKVPLLFWVTFVLCVPVFFVLHALAGVADDFRESLRCLLATQAAMTLILLGLAPVTWVWYLSSDNYLMAIAFNGGVFACASLMAHLYLRRLYAGLISRHAVHRRLLAIWLILFVFVAIQFAWVLRPFIGEPSSPAQFFRSQSWGNAYVALFDLLRGLFLK